MEKTPRHGSVVYGDARRLTGVKGMVRVHLGPLRSHQIQNLLAGA